MFAVMATAPQAPEDEFDIVKEINQSRQLAGFRIPDPEPSESPKNRVPAKGLSG